MVTVRFVAKLLRSKVNSENTNCFKDKINSIDHDKEIKKNFWGYVKEFIKKPNQILPNFNREICTHYCFKIFRTMRPLRSYVIPEWIPKFSRPTIDFRREPPNYQEIAKIIRENESIQITLSIGSSICYMSQSQAMSLPQNVLNCNCCGNMEVQSHPCDVGKGRLNLNS